MSRLRLITAALLAVLALSATACGGDDKSDNESADKPPAESTTEQASPDLPKELETKPKVDVPSGPPPKQLKVKDIVKGQGGAVKSGDQVSVQYVGVHYKNGKEFDSSWSAGQPFQFTLGAGDVIPGWDQGIEGMRAGGRRELIIPPDLAYGAEGSPPAIGPNETLVFVVDVVSTQ